MRRRTKLFILLLVVAIIATSAAYAIQIHEYALQGSKSRPMRTNTSLKKDTTGSALVAITSVYNMESERYLGADVYGWADVYLYRDAYNFQIATSTSGTDNKVTVGMGINGKKFPIWLGEESSTLIIDFRFECLAKLRLQITSMPVGGVRTNLVSD